MPFQKNCRVIERGRLADNLFSLVFDCSDIAGTVKAGQFVHISCGDGLLLLRPISVCDLDGSLVRIVFEVKGPGTAWLSERKPGDELDILGRLGKGFVLTETDFFNRRRDWSPAITDGRKAGIGTRKGLRPARVCMRK